MDAVDRIRAFNRAHTKRIGLLDQAYLEAGLTLPDVRVLFELSGREDWTARDLATFLGVTEGYLSRVIGRLEEAGLVARTARPEDRRVLALGLTAAGRVAADRLQALSRAQVGHWFAERPPGTAESVADLLEAAEAGMTGAVPEIEFRELAPGDAGWLIGQHGALYAQDEGFDASFEALVAEILAGYLRSRDASCERAWIAWAGGQRLGSIFCVRGPEAGVAKLRLFLLVPEARGLGLGQRLLDLCLGYARERGYRRITLWTHESHRAACALYAKNGFSLDEARATHSFGVDVVEQQWSRAL